MGALEGHPSVPRPGRRFRRRGRGARVFHSMSEVPDNVDLNWIARQIVALRDDSRASRADMDMLIRIVTRLDHTVDAFREDVRTLWLNQGDLRRRLEALEAAQK